VEVAGIVHQPQGRWMAQVARNLTDVASGFLRDGYYVTMTVIRSTLPPRVG
jgi:hypothetical protein